MNDVVFRGGQLVTPNDVVQANLAVQEGKIAAISAGELAGREVVDCRGLLLLPGGIDGHVHVSSSEVHPEGWTRLSHCAARGGVTTVVDMPYDAPQPTVNATHFRRKVAELKAESVVDAALYGTITKRGGVGEIRGMAQAGASAFKFSTYETDPQRFPRIPNDELWRALQELAALGLPAVFHAEDGEIIDALVAELKTQAAASQPGAGRLHAQSRPPVSEMVAVAGLLELARQLTRSGSPVKLHIAHLTVPEGFHLLDHYRQLGVNVTAETCIHYLALTEDDLARLGAPLKCNPPLRPAEMQDALWGEVLAGRVAFITTDHAPWPPELKAKANIFENRSGMPGLEWLLPLLYAEGVVKRGLPITEFARLTASGPADFFGLSGQKGRLQVGLDADLLLLDPQGTHTIRASESPSIAGHSPYEGWTLPGKIVRTVRRGKTIFDGRQVAPGAGGQFIQPQGRA